MSIGKIVDCPIIANHPCYDIAKQENYRWMLSCPCLYTMQLMECSLLLVNGTFAKFGVSKQNLYNSPQMQIIASV